MLLPKLILKGFATRIPGAYNRFSKGTGGTLSARYCYSVWLRHLVLAQKAGMSGVPKTVAELGPGDSLGIGLSALLSGSSHYYGLDVVKHSTDERNLKIFDELVLLFKQKAKVPDSIEFPNIFPLLEDYSFPEKILTPEILAQCLESGRIQKIRQELSSPLSAANRFINYFVPWDDEKVIQPASVDFIFSQFVLEHVNDLEKTYPALHKWLKPAGLMSHMIDFRCHGTAEKWNGHWAYSDFLWGLIKGGRPFLLNREPVGAHLRLLAESGFTPINPIIYQRDDGIARDELDPKYKNFSNQDLNCWGIFVQAKKNA